MTPEEKADLFLKTSPLTRAQERYWSWDYAHARMILRAHETGVDGCGGALDIMVKSGEELDETREFRLWGSEVHHYAGTLLGVVAREEIVGETAREVCFLALIEGIAHGWKQADAFLEVLGIKEKL